MSEPSRNLLPFALIIALLAVFAAAPCASVLVAAPPATKGTKKASVAPKKKTKHYEEIRMMDPKDPTKPLKDAPEWKAKKTTLLTEGKFSEEGAAAEEKAFTDHYRLMIAEFSHEEQGEGLFRKHGELKKELNSYGRAPEKILHAKLRDMLWKALPKLVATDKYAPEARVNWLLILGDLNAEEGNIGGDGAVPYPVVLPELMKIIKNQDPTTKYPLYLQTTALVGVMRHLSSGRQQAVSADQRRDLARIMAAWLQKPPTEGLSPDVHNFLRRRATEVLRVLAKGPEANSPEVVESLQIVAADEAAPLDTRCDAVRTLGVLDAKSFPDKSVAAVARTIATLAAEIARQTETPEPAADEPADEVAAADAPAGDMPAGDQPAAGEPPAADAVVAAPPKAADAEPDDKAETKAHTPLAPELQAYFLRCVLVGIDGQDGGGRRGLAAAATAENKQLITDLKAKVEEMVNVVKNKKKSEKLTDAESGRMHALATAVDAIVNNRANEQARNTP